MQALGCLGALMEWRSKPELSEHLGWVFLSYIVPEMILCSNRQQASIEEAKQLGQSPMGGIDCVPIFSLLLCVQITCPFSWITSYFISVI
jgi:hypothetical protein